MTAACNFLPSMKHRASCRMFLCLLSLIIIYKFSPGCTRLDLARSLTLAMSRPISVLYLLSKGSLPEDIIKSDEGASVTIC